MPFGFILQKIIFIVAKSLHSYLAFLWRWGGGSGYVTILFIYLTIFLCSHPCSNHIWLRIPSPPFPTLVLIFSTNFTYLLYIFQLTQDWRGSTWAHNRNSLLAAAVPFLLIQDCVIPGCPSIIPLYLHTSAAIVQ